MKFPKVWISCIYSCRRKLLPVHHFFGKLLFYFPSSDQDRLWELEKDRDGLWFLSWDRDLSLLSLESDLLRLWGRLLPRDCTEVEDSSYGNHLEGDDPKRGAQFPLLFSPFHSPTLTAATVFFHPALGQRQWHLGGPQSQGKQSQEGFEQPTHFTAVPNSQKPTQIQSCSIIFKMTCMHLTI